MTYIPQGDFALNVAHGLVGDTSALNKVGVNGDVDNAASEYIWSRGGNFVLPTTARLHDIVSTSANDDGSPVGTGAGSVVIYGLDASYALQSEVVTLNGVLSVTTANTYTMIHRMVVDRAGSSNYNEGTITATAQTDATVTAQIEPQAGQTQMAIYLVPAGKTFYMTNFSCTIDRSTGGAASVLFEVMEITKVDSTVDSEVVRHVERGQSENAPFITHTFNPYKKFSAKSLVFIRVSSDVNNVEVAGDFDGYLKDD